MKQNSDEEKRSDAAAAYLESVVATVKAACAGHIGEPVTANGKRALTEAVADALTAISGDDVTVVKTQSLWETMRWKERLKWFAANWILPWIGNRKRAQVDELNLRLWRTTDEEEFVPVSPPPWAQDSPKSLLIVEASISVAKPLNSINLTYHAITDAR